MNRKALFLLGVFLLSPATSAYDWQSIDDDSFDYFVNDDAIEPRFLTNLNFTDSGTFVTFNKTLLLFTSGIVLWGIAGAMLLYYLLTVPATGTGFDYDYDGGYGSTGGSSGGYSRSNGRGYSPYGGIDWEKFSILDWISVAEETYRKFEPYNISCQKKLICELHQNVLKFGYVAKKLVDIFSYLEYAQMLRLPEELKVVIDEYLDAADRGRSMKKDCADIYPSCIFSVKRVVDRVTDNEI